MIVGEKKISLSIFSILAKRFLSISWIKTLGIQLGLLPGTIISGPSKLAAIYNIFDGEELLQASIDSLRMNVDVVILVCQKISNYGNPHPDPDRMNKFEGVDRIIWYDPNVKLRDKFNGQRNESIKRVLGCKTALEMGATHFLHVDCDECYDADEFFRAKERIFTEGADSSACKLYTYFKLPIYRVDPPEEYYVPFIHRLDSKQSRFGKKVKYPVNVDPSRRTSPNEKFILFTPEELMMHHFSYVRSDIQKKFANNSSQRDYPDTRHMIDRFEKFVPGDELIFPFSGRKVIEVENKFNIDCDEFRG